MASQPKVFRGDRLKLVRETRGLTQDDLNKRLGLGNTQVYRYENGKAEPTTQTVVSLARELGVSADYLLGLSDDPLDKWEHAALSAEEIQIIEARRRNDLREYVRLGLEQSEP